MKTKDLLVDKIKHEYLLYYSNFAVDSCFWIINPRKYHLCFKRDRAA